MIAERAWGTTSTFPVVCAVNATSTAKKPSESRVTGSSTEPVAKRYCSRVCMPSNKLLAQLVLKLPGSVPPTLNESCLRASVSQSVEGRSLGRHARAVQVPQEHTRLPLCPAIIHPPTLTTCSVLREYNVLYSCSPTTYMYFVSDTMVTVRLLTGFG